jgi:hypothetical protein
MRNGREIEEDNVKLEGKKKKKVSYTLAASLRFERMP